MGQKSNLLTLKPHLVNINLNELNTKIYLNLFKLLENLIDSFLIKNVYVVEFNVNISANQCFLNFKCFYKTLKITAYRKKKLKRRKFRLKKKKPKLVILDTYFSLLRVNTFIFSFFNFNKLVNKKLVLFIYKKTNKFIKQVFSRQFALYIDFLKITSLLLEGLVGSNLFLTIIATIFKNLDKNRHSRFIFFLRGLFKLLTNENLNIKTKGLQFRILGVKFVIQGRLQGKPRASNSIILIGSVPTQSFKKNVDYSLNHIYTKLGAFGIKLWLHKSNI